ncbi:MerR family DNA-binding transcriptional regulator [Streptomyces albidoflavus]
MRQNLQTGAGGERLRPVDLARAHGLSTQAVRNYEEAGILPAAGRTRSGYRVYTPLHAAALGAFLALLPGHGHRMAAKILRAVHQGAAEEAFAVIAASHAQLLEDRRTLHAVESALRDLEPEPAPEGRALFVGPLAHQLGVRPAALRKWEAAGLVQPRRDPRTGYRLYDEAAVRDARLTQQLRRGGHLLHQITPLIAQVRAAGGLEPLAGTLDAWHARLTGRGRALLAGAAELEAYLRAREEAGRGSRAT